MFDRFTCASAKLDSIELMAEGRRDVGLLAITSADRLHAGWNAAQGLRQAGQPEATRHVERLFAAVPPHCGLVSVLDGHPATLAWLGSVHGHRQRALGVSRFGQTGTIADLYHHRTASTRRASPPRRRRSRRAGKSGICDRPDRRSGARRTAGHRAHPAAPVPTGLDSRRIAVAAFQRSADRVRQRLHAAQQKRTYLAK